ncbi:MAG TPA: reverse transcriptase domain-containing protein, partial [Methylococcales bacterium]
SYLSGRAQRVTVGQASSNFTPILTGVPQGSVLGPLLFTLYTSPIGHIVNSWGVNHQQYADDTQLFVPLQTVHSISVLENCLTDLHNWFCLNGLALNPNKSETINFSTSQRARFSEHVAGVNVAGTTVSTSPPLEWSWTID